YACCFRQADFHNLNRYNVTFAGRDSEIVLLAMPEANDLLPLAMSVHFPVLYTFDQLPGSVMLSAAAASDADCYQCVWQSAAELLSAMAKMISQAVVSTAKKPGLLMAGRS